MEGIISLLDQFGLWSIATKWLGVAVPVGVALLAWLNAQPAWAIALIALASLTLFAGLANQVGAIRARMIDRKNKELLDEGKHKKREKLINECKELVSQYFGRTKTDNLDSFREFSAGSRCVLEILPYLSPGLRDALTKPTHFIGGLHGGFYSSTAGRFLSEVEKLEKEWGLSIGSGSDL